MGGPQVKSVGKRFSAAGLVFVLVVLAEILAFVGVWHLIGFGLTFLLLLVLSGVGVWLLRREGTRAWRRFRAAADAGERPGPDLARSVVGLVAAILIAVPGFVTGLLGLLLLVPPVRVLAGRGAMALTTRRLSSSVAGDLFGPRMVKVRVGKPTRDVPGAQSPIEGEIV
jgi:UPF0716 protein FxsA